MCSPLFGCSIYKWPENKRELDYDVQELDYDASDNLISWDSVVDVSDNVLLKFELLVVYGHFWECFLYRLILIHYRIQHVAIILARKPPTRRYGVSFYDFGNYLRDNLSKPVLKINFAGNWLGN